MDFPIPIEYSVSPNGVGFTVKVKKIQNERVFIEDMPSLQNLPPDVLAVFTAIEKEKSDKAEENLKKMGKHNIGDKKSLEEYERDLNRKV